MSSQKAILSGSRRKTDLIGVKEFIENNESKKLGIVHQNTFTQLNSPRATLTKAQITKPNREPTWKINENFNIANQATIFKKDEKPQKVNRRESILTGQRRHLFAQDLRKIDTKRQVVVNNAFSPLLKRQETLKLGAQPTFTIRKSYMQPLKSGAEEESTPSQRLGTDSASNQAQNAPKLARVFSDQMLAQDSEINLL